MRRFVLAFLFLLVPASSWAQTTYYLDVTTGNDGDDGLSEGNAWQTFEKATTSTVAGDTVFVKASASYTAEDTTGGGTDSVWNLKTAGVGTESNPVLWFGYSTTITESVAGIVTIDASSNTLANCLDQATGSVNLYHTVVNFRFTGASGVGALVDTADRISFENCRFDNNGSHGVSLDNFNTFFLCQADNNSGAGYDVDQETYFVNCESFANGNDGFIGIFEATAINCVSYDNTGYQIDFGLRHNSVINCTVDGNNSTQHGIRNLGLPAIVSNCIVFDCDDGITGTSGAENGQISRNNISFSNTANFSNWTTHASDIFEDPLFDVSLPYRLQSGSPALAAGIDAGELTTSTVSYIDIGAIQLEAAGGDKWPFRGMRRVGY